MSQELTKEVRKLAILIAREMQKHPTQVTPDMLIALRSCAQILDKDMTLEE